MLCRLKTIRNLAEVIPACSESELRCSLLSSIAGISADVMADLDSCIVETIEVIDLTHEVQDDDNESGIWV